MSYCLELIIDFLHIRIEFCAPRSLMKALLTFGDRTFEQLLMIASNAKPPRKDDDRWKIEDKRWDRRNIGELRELLNTSSRDFIIDQIAKMMDDNDRKQTELRDRIRFLERTIDNRN